MKRDAIASDEVRTERPDFVGTRPDLEDSVAIRRPAKPALLFSRYRQLEPHLGIIEPTPLANRLMVSVELQPRGSTDMFRDGVHLRRPVVRPGSLGLFDLRASWAADVHDPFDNVNLFLPTTAIDEFAAEQGMTCSGLNYRVEAGVQDEVVLHLARALLPALTKPHEANTLFLDHMMLAFRDHIAQTYGAFSRRLLRRGHGLNAQQTKRVLDYLEAYFQTDISMADIAAAINVSVSSLGPAFKQSLGRAPHQWLMHRRVERAKELLREGNRRMSEVALSCGFADQSHLTRVFGRFVGLTPLVWRRIHRK
jgi:AraC family transcriptional regulator